MHISSIIKTTDFKPAKQHYQQLVHYKVSQWKKYP